MKCLVRIYRQDQLNNLQGPVQNKNMGSLVQKLRISRWRQKSVKTGTGPCVLAQLIGHDGGPDPSMCYSNTVLKMDDCVVTISPVFLDAFEHNHMKQIRLRFCSITFYLPLSIGKG